MIDMAGSSNKILNAAQTSDVPASEREAPDASALQRKTNLKFLIRRWFGEPYVGKRMKMRHLSRLMSQIPVPRSSRLLEVGSEDGVFSEWLSRRFPEATVEGLELDTSQSAACALWAEKSGRSERLRFRQGDVLELAEQDTYDLIICLDVLGYIPNDREAIKRMVAALKPGGWLVVHQPNTTYRRFGGHAHLVLPEEAGRITKGHIRHGYSPDELVSLLKGESSLHIERIVLLNGPFSDLAHRAYTRLEHPAALRLLAMPVVDLLTAIDRARPVTHGNTVCAIARKAPAAPFSCQEVV